MGGGSTGSTNPPKVRKRVEADTLSQSLSLKRARDGSAFARCEECKSSVAVALIDMHNCSLEARIKMSLDSQLVEQQSQPTNKSALPNNKPSNSKKSTQATSESKSKKRKLSKAKDPNMPKRPPTPYFLFLDDFRKTYKEEHPDSKGVKEVAKEAGKKWGSLTQQEKKAYVDKVKELKEEYDMAMEAYKTASQTKHEEESGDHQAQELCDEDA